jgi:hypothetical protein
MSSPGETFIAPTDFFASGTMNRSIALLLVEFVLPERPFKKPESLIISEYSQI